MIHSVLRYDLMGIIPRGESPWGWTPTIHFGMVADAINVSETTYLTDVRYYLANLGTTMESQVRSSVDSVYSVYSVSPSVYPVATAVAPSIYPFYPLFSCASLCAVLPSASKPNNLHYDLAPLVAARLSRTRILAVTFFLFVD